MKWQIKTNGGARIKVNKSPSHNYSASRDIFEKAPRIVIIYFFCHFLFFFSLFHLLFYSINTRIGFYVYMVRKMEH